MAYVQWTTPDENCFFPAGIVVKQLPPGYYNIRSTSDGLFFEKKLIKTENLIRFPDANSEKVLSEINKFWLLESKFRESKIPYKRGLIMFGPPGSGKTCTLRLVVDDVVNQHKGLVVDFPGSTNMFKGAYEILRKIHPNMPLIVVMEDLDAILYNTNESELLNLLDGMYGIDKIVFLATTNYPEKLGSRVMNRPSRFDKRFFIGMPSEEARRLYFRSKLLDENEVVRWARDTKGLSIAHLKELYVATKILGDCYEDAIKLIGNMRTGAKSTDFDDYQISEDKELGTGEFYKLAKSKLKYDPNMIAQQISEDIRRNNGLI